MAGPEPSGKSKNLCTLITHQKFASNKKVIWEIKWPTIGCKVMKKLFVFYY